jgi:2-C-methyl-D-erythritol 4-phosphate cytidylyltransferase/2-C-methyl-D-erythritol 2,4-cyclodiphosphate synthase
MQFSAILVAAGSGTRAGPGALKTWRSLGGKAVARWSAEALLAAGANPVIVVISADMAEQAARALDGLPVHLVDGGATRAASTRKGLALAARLAPDRDRPVLIHDAVRPFVTATHVSDLLDALAGADGSVPALPVADTLKRSTEGGAATAPRGGLWRAQTPQAFRLGSIIAAHDAWTAAEDPTDDAAAMEHAGGKVAFAPGDPMLFKLTYPEDFAMAEQLAGAQRLVRIGQGFDAHTFGPGDSVTLCGVPVAHGFGMVGHSDADAGLHALTDALLGAIGEADIGEHFPPADPKWRGAASDQFVRHALSLVRAKGGQVLNVDVTLICEAPKIKPHRQAMRENIARLLELPLDRVSVKATTTEGMGFTGRREGLAAQAVVSVSAPA